MTDIKNCYAGARYQTVDEAQACVVHLTKLFDRPYHSEPVLKSQTSHFVPSYLGEEIKLGMPENCAKDASFVNSVWQNVRVMLSKNPPQFKARQCAEVLTALNPGQIFTVEVEERSGLIPDIFKVTQK